MRTTIAIDDDLLAAAKVRAARNHQTIGAVLEDALRALFDSESARVDMAWALPEFHYEDGLRESVDLYDKDQMADLLGDDEMTRALS